MKISEFLTKLIQSNSGYSSKRLAALILIASGIVIPVMCLFIKPIGVIDDSVLVLSLQLLAAGCGLLGFTLGEAKFHRRPSPSKPAKPKVTTKPEEEVIDG